MIMQYRSVISNYCVMYYPCGFFLKIQAIANASITGFVAVTSLFVMKAKFKMIHYASMLISCAGMVMVILEDFNSHSDDGGICVYQIHSCIEIHT